MRRALFFLLFAACASRHELVAEEHANLVLLISNQGPAIPEVDITVWIDGRLAADGRHEVGDQHNVETLYFRLEPGKHTLRARSRRGGAEIEQRFELPARRWAGLNFWAPSPAPGAVPQGRFSFEVRADEPFIE